MLCMLLVRGFAQCRMLVNTRTPTRMAAAQVPHAFLGLGAAACDDAVRLLVGIMICSDVHLNSNIPLLYILLCLCRGGEYYK
jgi:hypothetical protein